MSNKLAGSRWRSAENLLKLLERGAKIPRIATNKGPYDYVRRNAYQPFANRLDVLQSASDFQGLNKQVGAGYSKALEELNWRAVPNTLKKHVEATQNTLAEPKVLFRGVTPGKNLVKPTEYDNLGKPAKFVHATPLPSNVIDTSSYGATYGTAFGNSDARFMQLFKPTPNQAYTNVAGAHNYVTKGLKNPTDFSWASRVKAVNRQRLIDENTDKSWFHKLKNSLLGLPAASPKKNMESLNRFMYETPILNNPQNNNTFLGNFVYRTNKVAPDSNLLNSTMYARIPNNLTNKFKNMGLEQQREIALPYSLAFRDDIKVPSKWS